jgi:Universal stress protein family
MPELERLRASEQPRAEPATRITIIPGPLAREMAELASAAGWDVRPARAAAADLEAAPMAGARGRLVLFVPAGSRLPSCLTHVLVPHDATPATSAVLATVLGDTSRWSQAEIVMLHVAAAELPSQPGSLPAPRMIDHQGSDWSDWREEFDRRFGRISPGMLVSVELASGAREESILTMARELGADLLILAWSGVLEDNRARTVRSLCALAPCPVLLVAGGNRGSIGDSLDAAAADSDG